MRALCGGLMVWCVANASVAVAEQPEPPSAVTALEASEPVEIVVELDPVGRRLQEAEALYGEHHAARLARFIDEAPSVPPGGVVMLGDSLTQGFPTASAFPGAQWINRGISGDKVAALASRLDVSVASIAPSAVYVMVGINEFVWYDMALPPAIWDDYRALFEALKVAAPDATIHIQSVLPVGPQLGYAKPRIEKVNRHLRELADEYGFQWVDIHARMVDEDGYMRQEFTADGVHLTLAGYLQWLEVILSPEQFVEAAVAVADSFRSLYGQARTVHAINPEVRGLFPGGRGTDQLVVYTPESGETTGTNAWGFEAVVEGGRVARAGGNNLAIPAEGIVVSGHGSSASWVSINLTIGTEVVVDPDAMEIRVVPVPEGERTDDERLEQIRNDLVDLISVARGTAVAAPIATMAHKVLLQVLEVRRREPWSGRSEVINELAAERDRLVERLEPLMETASRP